MTPSARAQAAIEILDGLSGTTQPADRLLRDWFRARRYAGSKDRAAIGEMVFAVLRRRHGLAWRMQSESPRALVLALLLAEGKSQSEIENLFSGAGYGPAPLTAEEQARLTSPTPEAPHSVQGEFPAFLQSELERSFGTNLLAEMCALTARAPVDLRINRLKADREEVLQQLQSEGFAAEKTSFSPLGIRIPSGEGLSALSRHSLFEAGAFEFQDEAAQIAALIAGARPGMNVLDLAAGAGGKSLALAAEMNGRGEILACDIDGKRLAGLEPRALRAGGSIIRPHVLRGQAPEGAFDLVFLDAPCSGTGIWRRQPELRGRLTQNRLDELTALQDRLLDQAAARTAPGGRLVYATCSLLPCENEDRIARFRARHPHFSPLSAAKLWREQGFKPDLPITDDFFRASPYSTGTDGFFVAVLQAEKDR